MMKNVARQGVSIRTQLVVTNIAVLTVLMVALGVIIHYAVASTTMASIDRQLVAHTKGMVDHPPPGPPHDHGPWPWDHGGGPNADMPPLLGFGGPHDDGGHHNPWQSPDWGHPPTPADAREFREQDKFRPRRFGPDGRSSDPDPSTYSPWSMPAFLQSKGGALVLATIDVDGQPYRMISRPYPSRGPIEGVLQDVYPLDDVERALRGVDRVLWTLSPLALICAGLAGWILTGRVLSRVRHMTVAAARIGSEDFSRRIPVSGSDEFSQLGQTFNNLLGRLEAAIEHEKRLGEQQRRFTADASHELKTPLTIIKGNTDMALATPSTEAEYRETLKEISQAADTMGGLVRDLLLLARADAGRLAQSPIDVLVTEIAQRAVAGVQRPGTASITVDVPSGLTVHGNEDELTRLLTNLLDNAVRHTPTKGKVTISASVVDDVVRIIVADTGVGIDAAHLPHLGERFYRVDSARARTDGGTGLGLSICRNIAEAHGGRLVVASVVGQGTSVTVELPFAEPG